MVQNITDVGHLVADAEEGEDKIEKEARALGKTPEEIARQFEKEHFEDLKNLNILKPNFSPRASEHIKEMIDFIKVLIKKGHAYESGGNVYFAVSSFSDYGQLSGRKVDEMISGARIKVDPRKKSPADFALWLKADASHLQKWPSPWGEGYPGWHLECSVLSTKYLGQPFDIHGSANEHIFPHHENEIAQSRSYAGKPLANYWLHTGMLLIDSQKMAKSTGNFITVRDALKEYDADTIKIAFMGTHWRKPYDWVKSATSEAEKIRLRLVRAQNEAPTDKTNLRVEINKALENDFNVPQALAIILGNLTKLSHEDFNYLKEIFGLKLEGKTELTSEQEKMVQVREKAREKGDYQEADNLRKRLEEEGIIVEDTPQGPRIMPKS
jgi:cysteinyl-tRNA synthetase